jgi:AraC-like DNA-binding protein
MHHTSNPTQTALGLALSTDRGHLTANLPHPGHHRPTTLHNDPLSLTLQRVQIRAWVAAMSELSAPWGLTMPSGPGGFFAVFEGSMLFESDTVSPPILLGPGDIIVLIRSSHHSIRDSAGSPVRPIHEVLSPRDIARHAGIILPGKGPVTRFTCGLFHFDTFGWHQLSRSLPPCLLCRSSARPRGSLLSSAVALLERQVADSSPGTHVAMNHLATLIFVEALRAHVSAANSEGLHARPPEGWLGALLDINLGPVLGMLHADPAREWSLQQLADEAGLSRTIFHERFTAALGQPPMTYLRECRMRLAADLIVAGELELRGIAKRTGYRSEGALCSAFKKWSGKTPGEFRAEHQSSEPRA